MMLVLFTVHFNITSTYKQLWCSALRAECTSGPVSKCKCPTLSDLRGNEAFHSTQLADGIKPFCASLHPLLKESSHFCQEQMEEHSFPILINTWSKQVPSRAFIHIQPLDQILKFQSDSNFYESISVNSKSHVYINTLLTFKTFLYS